MLDRVLDIISSSFPSSRELRRVREALERIHADIDAIRTMIAAHCCDLELTQNPRYSESRRLPRHGFQVNSQNGEDGVIHEIFRRIGTSNRVFAEIGVGDGTENNTAFLLSQGWKGFWLDANDTFRRIVDTRADLGNSLTCLVAFARKENIAGLFKRLGVPKEFDLLSVDVDQNTFYVWEALQEFTPRVVVIEYNAAIPPDVDWNVEYAGGRIWDISQNFGASLKAFEVLGRRLGYSLVGCEFNGVNAFFVRDDLVADKFAAPFTAQNHYERPRYAFVHRAGHARAVLDRPVG